MSRTKTIAFGDLMAVLKAGKRRKKESRGNQGWSFEYPEDMGFFKAGYIQAEYGNLGLKPGVPLIMSFFWVLRLPKPAIHSKAPNVPPLVSILQMLAKPEHQATPCHHNWYFGMPCATIFLLTVGIHCIVSNVLRQGPVGDKPGLQGRPGRRHPLKATQPTIEFNGKY